MKIKTIDNKCMKLWRELVKLNAGNRCEVCGVSDKVKMCYCHHYIGRRTKLLRLEPRNGVYLCFQHHTGGVLSAHNDPEWFRQWMREHRLEDHQFVCKKRKAPVEQFHIGEYQKALKRLENALKLTTHK